MIPEFLKTCILEVEELKKENHKDEIHLLISWINRIHQAYGRSTG